MEKINDNTEELRTRVSQILKSFYDFVDCCNKDVQLPEKVNTFINDHEELLLSLVHLMPMRKHK
jgi:hypothetical protein